MRRLLLSLSILIVTLIGHQADAAPPKCDGVILFSTDYIVCNDDQLTALDEEVERLFIQSGQTRPPGLLNSERLRRSIEATCQLPKIWIEAADAIRRRSCIVSSYIRELRKYNNVPRAFSERHYEQPNVAAVKKSYFVILAYRSSFADANDEADRLSKDFPYEQFAVYPPNEHQKLWTIALASFVDQARANRIRDLALALGISATPVVWQNPSQLPSGSADWKPAMLSSRNEPAIVGPLAQQTDDLSTRITLWRKDAVLCNRKGNVVEANALRAPDDFPTKQFSEDDKRKERPEKCNDGDMALFNGLLCASGEAVGCSAVKHSQSDSSHQWWRSPAIKLRGADHDDEPNLNSDQVLGVLLYVLQENDSAAFRNWLEWIKSIGPPLRFCSLNTSKCYFRPIDCPLITLVGFALVQQNSALSVCAPSGALGLPLPAGFVPRFKDAVSAFNDANKALNGVRDALGTLTAKLGGLPPKFNPLPPLPTFERFTEKLTRYEEQFQRLVNLIQSPDPLSFALSYHLASGIVTANAAVAGIGQPAGASASARHLAATSIFLLQKFRFPDPTIRLAAAKLADQGRDNPYFEFLANGRTQRMQELLSSSCNYNYSNNEPKFQWSWERSVAVDAARQTMLWDCIFAANLLQRGLTPFKTKPPTDPTGLISSAETLLKNAKEAAAELEALVKEVLDQRSIADEAAKNFQNQVNYAKQMLDLAAGSAPTYKDGKVTAPLAPPLTPGNPTATVDLPSGRVGVKVGGRCIGFC